MSNPKKDIISKLSFEILNIADKIEQFAKHFETIKNFYPEIVVLILFPIIIFGFGFFHEPWFDEAQAWQIAKCATYKDILFYLPHYEGHPPFWHLFLSIFAKNNFPYEITIKIISFIFSYVAVILILFKSPFYRIIRILLPFTYFFCYQYTIISRPYCLIALAFAILAINYKTREENPIKYTLGLIFLSTIHTYAYIISGMLFLLWVFKNIKNKLLNSKKVACFIFLGIFYLTFAYLILPSSDAHALYCPHNTTLVARFFYSYFVMPIEIFLGCISNSVFWFKPSFCEVIIVFFVSVLILFFILYFVRNKKELATTFLVVYFIYALFSAKYLAIQHMGIMFWFVIYFAWISLLEKKDDDKNETDNILIKKCFILMVSISLVVSLYWNLKSCILDIPVNYAKGKKEAEFIKKNNLDKYKIMVIWYVANKDGRVTINTNFNGTWLSLAPYFDKNIMNNFNVFNPEKNYVLHKEIQLEEVEKNYEAWRKNGIPDVLLGEPVLEEVFGDDTFNNDYIIVYYSFLNYIIKGQLKKEVPIIIKVRKDLAKKLGLKKVEPEYIEYRCSLAKIVSYLITKVIEFYDKENIK